MIEAHVHLIVDAIAEVGSESVILREGRVHFFTLLVPSTRIVDESIQFPVVRICVREGVFSSRIYLGTEEQQPT